MSRAQLRLPQLFVLSTLIALGLTGCQNGKTHPAADEVAAPPAPSASSAAVSAASPAASPPSPAAAESPAQADSMPSASPASLSVACGKAAFGPTDARTELPLYCLRVKRAVEDPGDPTPALAPKEPLVMPSYEVPSGAQGKLAAFWMNYGNGGDEQSVLLLAPQDWEAESADMGADGSIGIRLTDPNDPRQSVNYQETTCGGCATADAARYFPELEKYAEDQGFPPVDDTDLSGITELTPHLAAYRMKPADPALETNGVAYQNLKDPEDVPFKLEEVTLGSSSRDWATAILNLFVKRNSH